MVILYFFRHLGPKILRKKIQVILSKNEGVMAIFEILDFFYFSFKVWTWNPTGVRRPPEGPKGPPALRRS